MTYNRILAFFTFIFYVILTFMPSWYLIAIIILFCLREIEVALFISSAFVAIIGQIGLVCSEAGYLKKLIKEFKNKKGE